MIIAASSLAFAIALSSMPAAAQTAPRTHTTDRQAALNEALWNAARAGHVAGVTRALERGAEINSGNRYKATALFFAADKGHVEIVKLLLDKGADINTTDTFYRTDDRFTADADRDASSRVLSERRDRSVNWVKLAPLALGPAELRHDDGGVCQVAINCSPSLAPLGRLVIFGLSAGALASGGTGPLDRRPPRQSEPRHIGKVVLPTCRIAGGRIWTSRQASGAHLRAASVRAGGRTRALTEVVPIESCEAFIQDHQVTAL